MSTSTTSAIVDRGIDDAKAATRRFFADQGYTSSDWQSTGDTLVFAKGMTAFSWGATVTVAFVAASPTTTHVTVKAKQTMSLVDWGRGKRLANKLFAAVAAA